MGSNECVGGCVSPRAVGCAVGFRAQPFASEWGKAEADDDHDEPSPWFIALFNDNHLRGRQFNQGTLMVFAVFTLALFTERKL